MILSQEGITTARHRTPPAGSLEWSGLLYSWDPPMADLLIEMPITVAAVRKEEYRVVLIAIHMLLTSSVVSCLAPADPAVEPSTSNGFSAGSQPVSIVQSSK